MSMDYDACANLLKSISHPIRLSLVKVLSDCEEMSVGSIQEVLDLPQSTVSQQLMKLKQVNAVSTRREGTRIYYKLIDHRIKQIIEIL
ncbi:MAG: ArsR/SmtB family transcription factor [Ruoffia tabacinasalis]|uniref:ArsR/SmtB family transcription factor n=1 Tax=Ruoffia TaxID=2862144 RepID=UPI000EE5AEC8|nr:transcriptional regulator [Aerococcaceae bacterium]